MLTNKYKMTNIGLALEYLLKNLQDDDNRKVFDNVILGLSEKDVKQFNNCIGIPALFLPQFINSLLLLAPSNSNGTPFLKNKIVGNPLILYF